MASRSKDERAHVNTLIKAMQKNSPEPFYVFIDRDAGAQRHTSSGWDFLLAYKGRVVFVEAKEENGKLSDWQEFTQKLIVTVETRYAVLRFWKDGAFYSIDGGLRCETERASLRDFFDF